MARPHLVSRLLVIGLLVSALGFAADESLPAANPAAAPRMFGVDDYTVTSVPAVAFVPDYSYRSWGVSGSLGRYGEINVDQHFFAPVDIPAGATIDRIKLNNVNDGTRE